MPAASSLRRFALSFAGLLTVALAAGSGTALAATESIEGERFSLPQAAGHAYADGSASGGRALLVWTNATASTSVAATAPARLTVRARGDQCAGAPAMTVRVDGARVLSASVSHSAWTTYGVPTHVATGTHTVSVSYTNDSRSGQCDRNLRLDAVTLTGATVSPTAEPLAEARLYVDPRSAAREMADAWRPTRPADAAQLEKIAIRPQAEWFGEWSGDVEAAVSRRVTSAAATGAVPVLVAYDVPERDCGSHSAGGLASAEAYRTWIRAFAKGIGTRPAVVVLEPDALALLGCLSAQDQATRLALLKDAVDVLAAQPRVSLYIDAGHSAWIGATEMAERLLDAGVGQAEGFALNVSNYRPTSELITYGKDLSGRVGGKHFVLDTSRNGLGPSADGEWCNPPGRALGSAPRTSSTADPKVDAHLWIKRPGESDGTCNGGPSAGTFWAEYALGLAGRAR